MKRLLFILISFAMLVFGDNAEFHDIAIPDFTYTVIDGEATITGFNGAPEAIIIPDELDGCPVVGIRDNAFYQCTSLKEISLPESIITMGHHCFYGCTSLEKIILPDSISEIGMGCFEGCDSLSEVVLPAELKSLTDSCFRECTSLTEINFPDRVECIEKFCFADCDSLSRISLNEGLTEIGDLAFFGCTSLKELHIPFSVRHIGLEAVGFCRSEDDHIADSELLIIGKKGSAAEEYANGCGIAFSGYIDTAAAVDTSDDPRSPVKLPKSLVFAGIGFFILACLSCTDTSHGSRK